MRQRAATYIGVESCNSSKSYARTRLWVSAARTVLLSRRHATHWTRTPSSLPSRLPSRSSHQTHDHTYIIIVTTMHCTSSLNSKSFSNIFIFWGGRVTELPAKNTRLSKMCGFAVQIHTDVDVDLKAFGKNLQSLKNSNAQFTIITRIATNTWWPKKTSTPNSC